MRNQYVEDVDVLEFQNTSMSIEQLHEKFSLILDQHQAELYDDSIVDEDDNPFLNTGLEEVRENTAHTSATNAFGTVAKGLYRKSADHATNTIKKGVTDTIKATPGLIKGLINAARKFMEKLSQFINTVSTMISKLLNTGYPLMGKLKTRAEALLENIDKAKVKEEEINLKKAGKLLSIDGKLLSDNEIREQIQLLGEMVDVCLTTRKLDQFKRFSSQVLEPYRDSIKGAKIDTVVFTMAVLAALTNPGVAVGVVLKKVFSAANPNLGEVADKSARVVGGLWGGLGVLALTTGATSASLLKQMSNGRLKITDIPQFHTLYTFCQDPKVIDGTFYVERKSPVLMGNRQWVVKDYVDDLAEDMKGGPGRIGASFKKLKSEIPEDISLKPLDPNRVAEILKTLIEVLDKMMVYCKAWPDYSKAYSEQYRKISDIVMTYQPDDEENRSVVAKYVRYSYRNSMNVMLGGIWNNCFGADNQFIRYVVSISRILIQYCEDSLDYEKESEETDN